MIIDVYYKKELCGTFEDIDDAQLYVEERCEYGMADEDDFTYRKH